MDTWQSWVALLAGAVVTYLLGSHQFEKTRKQKQIDDLTNKLEKSNERLNSMSERLTKVESEVVSDKEVREILKEFFLPFMSTLGEIQKDIQEVKVGLAKLEGTKATESNE